MLPFDFASLVFYVLAAITVFSGIMVISAKNPVHSVLFLIFAFFNSAGLFVLLGAEYIAMTLVIVYVGAVAVLFLFVVMMLNINFSEMRDGFLKYLPAGLIMAGVMLAELWMVLSASTRNNPITRAAASNPTPSVDALSNTEAIGGILYTNYVLVFQMAGMILLVAMIGAIVLTLRHRPDSRRQNIARQVSRTREQSIEIIKIQPGEGA